MLKVLENGTAPTKGSKYSACIDLYASETVVIYAGETKLVGLGVCIDSTQLKSISNRDMENTFGIPHFEVQNGDGDAPEVYFDGFMASHYLQLMLRSSLGKKGLIIPNGIGVIDMDYKDEIKVLIHNPITLEYLVKMIIGFLKRPLAKKEEFIVKKGDCIAQITLLEHKAYLFGIDTDEVRDGGFGSTNKKENNVQ